MTTADTPSSPDDLELADYGLEIEHFRQDLLEGLAKPQKEIPCKYLYDARGSRIFDRICEVKDYYPTRTETRIKRRYADEIADAIGARALVVEPGSGNGDKAIRLLETLDELVAYVPLEISKEHMMDAAERINGRFPDVEVLPVCADFTGEYRLPEPSDDFNNVLIYFPGSTIGNFAPEARQALLRSFAEHLRELGEHPGYLLIGFDLIKDRGVLERAYNDSEGVTAEFNMNVLRRANRELGADFDLERFEHKSVWNPDRKRIEMHLVSMVEQAVHVAGKTIRFAAGETIHTENSHKFSIDGFADLARAAGLAFERAWTDDENLFAVALFRAAA